MKLRKLTLGISVVVACLLAGCSTRSRLGSLIPAHHNSNKRTGEQVWLHVAPGAVISSTNQISAEALPIGPVVAAGVGIAVDYVRNQLQQEAQLYSAQFGQKVWLTTDQLLGGRSNYVLITRWVKGKPPGAPAYDSAIGHVSNIVSQAAIGSKVVSKSDYEGFTRSNTLAFAYCLEIDRATGTGNGGQPSPFLVRPKWKWQLYSKAKVVSFRSWQPWSWLGAIAMKTGNEVEYDVYLTVDSLLRRQDGVPGMVKVGISDAIQGPESFDLTRSPNLEEYQYGDRTSGWLAIPGYPENSSIGYLSLHVTVNESDPSNVKKTLLKGADYLDKNKQGLIDSLVGRPAD